jgi:hypothetical protein
MPGSVRVLRKTYGRLHAEGYINNKITILVRAGEKLVSENKILRKENEGLRGAIFEKKLLGLVRAGIAGDRSSGGLLSASCNLQLSYAEDPSCH